MLLMVAGWLAVLAFSLAVFLSWIIYLVASFLIDMVKGFIRGVCYWGFQAAHDSGLLKVADCKRFASQVLIRVSIVERMSALPKTKYRMSFSTGGLLPDECVQLAQFFVDAHDWGVVADKARADNILKFRTTASSHRTVRELIARLKNLKDGELEWLIEADEQLRGLILWVAACRLYQFVAEFMAELVQERYAAYRLELTHDDFDAFLNQKAEWHHELDSLTEMTRKKIRQILFRMMKEGGVLSPENRIVSPLPTSSVSNFRESLPDHERAFIPGWAS